MWGSPVSLGIEQVDCFGCSTHKFTFNRLLQGYKVKELSYQSLHRNEKNKCNKSLYRHRFSTLLGIY